LLHQLVVRDLRNLKQVVLQPGKQLTIIRGQNGQGKTSILEAIYLVATSRSFRTTRLGEVLRHGEDAGSVRAVFTEPSGIEREQVVGLGRGQRSYKIDGKRPANLSKYATRSPVVVFHAAELELTMGSASVRRKLLDRVALFVEATSGEHRARYTEALKARQKALQERGESGLDVVPFERLCAKHGAVVTGARRRAADVLLGQMARIFPELASEGLELEAKYVPGGSEDEGKMLEGLAMGRSVDQYRSSASFGPHRDELSFCLNGQPVRAVASQGQHRALVLALKLAELRAIAQVRGVFPVLLLDDISSELDRDRTQALLRTLIGSQGQVIITTTRPELIEIQGVSSLDRVDVEIDHGTLVNCDKISESK
jgi:DNA replication and repair protein RecF